MTVTCFMWSNVILLVMAALAVAAHQFDPNDESDYIDNPDEPSALQPDSTAPTVPTVKHVQGEIEKLLRQSVIHYEDPASSPHPPASPVTLIPSGLGQTVSNMEIYVGPTSRNKGLSKLGEAAGTSSETPGLGHRTWRLKTTRSNKPRRTSEAVYSVYVPSWGGQPALVQKKRPGVIESLVGAHDIVRRESTTARRRRAGAGAAYNDGGTRPRGLNANVASNTTWRRFLVEPPFDLSSHQTRPPRPTPTTMYLETTYKYTRLTRKHPNCTDDYYDCLALCFDRKGYRVRCKHELTARPPPARINMSGVIAAAIELPLHDYDTRNLVQNFKNWLLDRGYRTCVTYTTAITTPERIYPVYYDDTLSKNTGRIMGKCWVCGLLDQGIPKNANCADNFGSMGLGAALTEKNSYRRYCRYMDEVPLWFNRSDPFSVWGKWTGGCSYRWLDLSGLYTQRTCRSTVYPAMGHHYLSRRMATLELSLRGVKDGCTVSPMATLVPFSRAVSLYARFHVCVCTGSFCNHAARRRTLASVPIVVALLCVRL